MDVSSDHSMQRVPCANKWTTPGTNGSTHCLVADGCRHSILATELVNWLTGLLALDFNPIPGQHTLRNWLSYSQP